MSWKCKSFIGVCACCYNRSLILVLCFAISFRGYIPSSFPLFVSMRLLQSSCLLVTNFSLHHCTWDCCPVCFWLLLLLIDYCRKVAISCLIDTGVIVKPWDWSAMVLCMPLIKTISGPCSSSTFRLEVKHRTSHMRFVVSEYYRLAPQYPFELLSFDYG